MSNLLSSPMALGRHRSSPERPHDSTYAHGSIKPKSSPKSAAGLIFFGSVETNFRHENIIKRRTLFYDTRDQEDTTREDAVSGEHRTSPPEIESRAAVDEVEGKARAMATDDIVDMSQKVSAPIKYECKLETKATAQIAGQDEEEATSVAESVSKEGEAKPKEEDTKSVDEAHPAESEVTTRMNAKGLVIEKKRMDVELEAKRERDNKPSEKGVQQTKAEVETTGSEAGKRRKFGLNLSRPTLKPDLSVPSNSQAYGCSKALLSKPNLSKPQLSTLQLPTPKISVQKFGTKIQDTLRTLKGTEVVAAVDDEEAQAEATDGIAETNTVFGSISKAKSEEVVTILKSLSALSILTNGSTLSDETDDTDNTDDKEAKDGEVQTKKMPGCPGVVGVKVLHAHSSPNIKTRWSSGSVAKSLVFVFSSAGKGGNKELENITSQGGTTLGGNINKSLSIETSEADFDFNTFPSEGSIFEIDQIYVMFAKAPEAQSLLNDIEYIASSLPDEESANGLQRSAKINHHLLDRQMLLKSAPEDIRKDFYGVLSRIAILNAQVELELKKIRLESMGVESQMDSTTTFDDADNDTNLDSLATNERNEGLHFLHHAVRVAILSSEVESQRAELELKKIRLESMRRVESHIDSMTIFDDADDDDDTDLDSLATNESEEGLHFLHHAFDVFTKYYMC